MSQVTTDTCCSIRCILFRQDNELQARTALSVMPGQIRLECAQNQLDDRCPCLTPPGRFRTTSRTLLFDRDTGQEIPEGGSDLTYILITPHVTRLSC